MPQSSVSVRRRLFALAQLLFSLAILIGSSFEVLNLLVPSLIPQIQDMPLMRLHHSSRTVFYWTLLSNVATALLSAVLVRTALGTMRNEAAASHQSRRAILAFYFILVGSAIVSVVFLVPPALTMIHSDSEHMLGIVFLVSVISSLIGLTVFSTVLFFGHGAIQRRQRNAAA
jgi:Na+/melibiose symporter-like transporter